MRTQIAEFLRCSVAAPFALRHAEKAVGFSVTGGYDEALQRWIGADTASALTLTLTAVPGGSDRDAD